MEKYKSELVNKLLSLDGDDKLRSRLKDKYLGVMDDLKDQIRPDIPLNHANPDELANSYYVPNSPLPKWMGGRPEHIESGIPSRTVLAHELGHANSVGKSKLRLARRVLLAALANGAAAGSYPLLRRYTKLSKEKALALSSLATLGLGALHWWDVVNEEAKASDNALNYLREYNKTQPKTRQVDLVKAKNALDYARGTYKRGALWLVPSMVLGPASMYAYDKVRNK